LRCHWCGLRTTLAGFTIVLEGGSLVRPTTSGGLIQAAEWTPVTEPYCNLSSHHLSLSTKSPYYCQYLSSRSSLSTLSLLTPSHPRISYPRVRILEEGGTKEGRRGCGFSVGTLVTDGRGFVVDCFDFGWYATLLFTLVPT
jgi:hypothetical protein